MDWLLLLSWFFFSLFLSGHAIDVYSQTKKIRSFTKQQLQLATFGSYFGGLVCGIGLDGGSILAMVMMGIGEQVPHPTVQYMMMLSSFTATTIYYYFGALNLKYAALFGATAIVYTSVALNISNWLG